MVPLIFYCELEPAPLQALFADGSVVDALRRLGAGVSLGLLDLSDGRAQIARHLQDAGVPLIAWLLVDRADGYFAHAGNAPAVAARYDAFRAWSARHALRFEALGLDFEPDLRELDLIVSHPVRGLARWVRRAFDDGRRARAEGDYRALAARVRADGLRFETYQFPLLVDERRAGSRLLQRAAGLVDVPADREVLLLYSSLLYPRGPGPLCSYAAEAGAVAIGSTGGGLDHQPKLSREEFRRDLALADRGPGPVYVFSLEGCVQGGLLADLLEHRPAAAPAPAAARRAADALRAGLRGALRAARLAGPRGPRRARP
jgi:hypothetical protein